MSKRWKNRSENPPPADDGGRDDASARPAGAARDESAGGRRWAAADPKAPVRRGTGARNDWRSGRREGDRVPPRVWRALVGVFALVVTVSVAAVVLSYLQPLPPMPTVVLAASYRSAPLPPNSLSP
ncbi:MAG: hypothetical protein ACRDD1_21550, partial [Planctomycetia bacterium]